MSYKTDLLVDLKSVDYCAKYLRAAIADSVEAFLVALRDVGEAQQGMTKLATAAGVNRENLYRMLSGRGNPRLNNLKAVLDAVGLRIEFAPAKKRPSIADANRTISRHVIAAPKGLASGLLRGNPATASGSFISEIGSIKNDARSFGQGATACGWAPFSEPAAIGEGVDSTCSILSGVLNQPSAVPFVALPR